MRFQLDIALTEEDYLAFNYFHALESESGKKLIRKTSLIFIAAMVVLEILVFLVMGITTFSTTYMILLGVFTAIYVLCMKKFVKRSIKSQLKRMKQTGKLPYDPVAKLEFYEDKFVEITPGKHSEQSYDVFERICVFKDQYVFLFYSSITAYVLPISQIRAQISLVEFLSFLSGKCSTIEYD